MSALDAFLLGFGGGALLTPIVLLLRGLYRDAAARLVEAIGRVLDEVQEIPDHVPAEWQDSQL